MGLSGLLIRDAIAAAISSEGVAEVDAGDSAFDTGGGEVSGSFRPQSTRPRARTRIAALAPLLVEPPGPEESDFIGRIQCKGDASGIHLEVIPFPRRAGRR
jgi:hypothetical protein